MCGDPSNKPHPNLGSLARPPFYAVELRRIGGSAIPAAGVVSDHHSRAVGWDEKPIEGLYVAEIPRPAWKPGRRCKAASPTRAA